MGWHLLGMEIMLAHPISKWKVAITIITRLNGNKMGDKEIGTSYMVVKL
jgi:hypothetical protein